MTTERYVLLPEYDQSVNDMPPRLTKTGRLIVVREPAFECYNALAAGTKAACESAKALLEGPETSSKEPLQDAPRQ